MYTYLPFTYPFMFQVSLPAEYVNRLRVIYTVVAEKIYGMKPSIYTRPAKEGRFQTYVTIGHFTRRFNGVHHHDPVAMEADAIYYSLRYITNVVGYRIIDLNYPVLATLLSHINTWNAQINALYLSNSSAAAQMDQTYETICYAIMGFQMQPEHDYDLQFLNRATTQLDKIGKQSCDDMSALCQEFICSKVR